MQKVKKQAVMFLCGGFGYGALEVLWRGNTHWSMILTGGVVFLLFDCLNREMGQSSLVLRCVAGMLLITLMELAVGDVVNLQMHLQVWDYSDEFWNVDGQICLRYMVLWFGLSAPAALLAERISETLEIL